MTAQGKEYSVFISYKSEDVEWAIWLQHELEHYHLPTTLNGRYDVKQDLRPVFRDIDELSAGNLPEQIKRALNNSKNLVVVCSPLSAKSEWVNEEVKEFISLGRLDNIFPFIVDGESPAVYFPPALLNLPKNKERLGGDVKQNGKDAAFVKIVAGILGLDFDTLWNRYEREKAEEERKSREQRDNLLRIQSLFLAEKANTLIEQNEYDIASLLALEALPDNIEEPNRPYVSEVELALRKSSVYTTPIIRSALGNCIQTDGSVVFTGEGDYQLKVWDMHNGKLLKNINLENYFVKCVKAETLARRWVKAITCLCDNKTYICTYDGLYAFDYNTEQLRLLFKKNDPIESSQIIISPNSTYYIWSVEKWFADTKIVDIYLCDTSSNEELLHYSYTASVSCSFSPNSKLVAFACHHDVHVIDIETKDCISKYRFYDVICCTFVDNTNIVIICSDKTIRLWNILSHEDKIIRKSDEDIVDVLYKDNILVFITSSNKIRVMDIRYNLSINQLEWSGPIKLLSFSNDGKKIYFRDKCSFRTWDFSICSDGSRLLYYHQNSINCAAYSKDASCYVSVSGDSIKLWDVEKRRIIKSIALGINHYVYLVAASMIYKKIFIISNGFYCIDIDSGTIKLVYDESGLCEMNLSGDEKYISLSGEDTIILFDTESLDIYKEIKLPQDHKLLWGKSIDFHPTEDFLVFAYTIEDDLESIHLCIWNYKIGASVVSVKLEGCSASEDMISFSECGDYVIYEGWHGVYRWFYRTNILERDDSVNPSSIQFSDRIIEPDGFYVVEKENMPLQQLMNQVREYLNGRQLTKEERQKYYLD